MGGLKKFLIFILGGLFVLSVQLVLKRIPQKLFAEQGHIHKHTQEHIHTQTQKHIHTQRHTHKKEHAHTEHEGHREHDAKHKRKHDTKHKEKHTGMHTHEHKHEHKAHKMEHTPRKAKHTPKKAELYHCPMHPTYVSDRPGSCPICGMDLVPVEAEEDELPPGAVKISPWREQLIGVRYARVERKKVEKVIRTVGYVEYAEPLVKSITLKFSGWVEKLWADWEGKFVRKGEPLLKIYSPDLASAQEDYLIALRTLRELGEGVPESVRRDVEILLQSARQKLLLFDLTPWQIRELEKTGKADPYVTIYSPISGFIIKKNVFEGQHITPNTEVFRIADISRVWVLIDIYEEDLPFVSLGQRVKIKTTFFPRYEYWGKVVYIYPYLNPDLRTVKVRVEVPNPDLTLKPGMYATAWIRVERGEEIVVPDDAVLFAGDRAYVFVRSQNPGVLVPRDVKLGERVEGGWIVLEGLEEGEEVVVSANFLIDSESKLKQALKALGDSAGAHQHHH